ncbi:Neprilysin-2 [Aphelenchoides bicaudatus]|nr:Neprilysin-2 [Aphelenchoides bicaudatus]
MVTEPRYYRALDGIFQDSNFDIKVLVNFMAMQYLMDHSDFIGGVTKDITKLINSKNFVLRKKDYDEAKLGCVGTAQGYMPYGTGYIYISNMTDKDRHDIVTDVTTQVNYVIEEFLGNVDTISWMTPDGRTSVRNKAAGLIKNIAYPYWFEFNSTKRLDEYHEYYSGLESVTDYFDLLEKLSVANQKTENLGKLIMGKVDRQNFQDSPATVNAWYEPTLNSITIPRAALNEPYYRLDFPQAYNYAGNGGTIGHEFTHGFDSDGVQYAGEGQLAPCNYQFCTILDGSSSSGFLNMSQCVISQYNEQCCPLKSGSIHCTNGVNTQGENIADIGGQYAAYKAYRKWIKKNNGGKEEDLLPGKMQMFTGNQIFWITYGFSWCMNQETSNLAHQLLTNEHAPGSCRVNQVMQDLPEFAEDFNCKPKATLNPDDDQRCHVWR